MPGRRLLFPARLQQGDTVPPMASEMRFPETVELNNGLDNTLRVEVLNNEIWVTVTVPQPPAYPDDEIVFVISKMQWTAMRTLIDRRLTE